jgi:hypothetical protein
MKTTEFASCLQQAVRTAWRDYLKENAAHSPYAFALIEGQCGGYLLYAIASESGLNTVVAKYDKRGYRYRGKAGEEFDNHEKLAHWLRWANPDDGWAFNKFPPISAVEKGLSALAGAFGEDAEKLEDFCVEVLTSIQNSESPLSRPDGEQAIVGVTRGENPSDFLRTATRCNRDAAVQRLLSEYRLGEEAGRKIKQP